MGVSLNGGTPISHPKMIVFSRKIHGCWETFVFGNPHVFLHFHPECCCQMIRGPEKNKHPVGILWKKPIQPIYDLMCNGTFVDTWGVHDEYQAVVNSADLPIYFDDWCHGYAPNDHLQWYDAASHDHAGLPTCRSSKWYPAGTSGSTSWQTHLLKTNPLTSERAREVQHYWSPSSWGDQDPKRCP